MIRNRVLRSYVAENYAVDSVLVMHDVDAFEEPVAAYPAITVLRNGPQGPAKVVDTAASLDEVAAAHIAG